MPPKRPAPLSDAALVPRGGQSAVLGETNAGVPLPVKNTFIDVPSGLTPTHSPTKKGQPVMTAPAQVNVAPGFIKRSLASVHAPSAALPATPSSPGSPMKITSALRGQVQPDSAVQRPGFLGQGFAVGSALPSTPLVTPSPSSNSLFSAARYQLFGGPAPLQEATYSALAPVGQHGGTLAAQGSLGAHAPLPAPQTSSFLSYGASTFVNSTHSTNLSCPTTIPQSQPVAAPAADKASGKQQFLRVAQESRSKESHSDEDEDGDDDSEEEEGQEPGVSTRSLQDAPKPPPGAQHPSLGSQNHEEGTCKRCCFFPRNRCLNGYECDFCHYEHEKRKRKNKKSKKKNKESSAAQNNDSGTAISGSASSTAPAVGMLNSPEASCASGVAAISSAWGTIPPEAQIAEVQMWESILAADQVQMVQQASLPPMLYDSMGGAATSAPQLVTYFWTDGIPGQPSTQPPSSSAPAAPTLSYFAAATGLQPPSLAGSTPAVSSEPPFQPVQPLYSQAQPLVSPLMAYPGVDGIGQPWLPPPVIYESPLPGLTSPQFDTDPAWQPPYPAPPYPAMAPDPHSHLQASADATQQAQQIAANPPNVPATPGPAPPPNEAPKLPQTVHVSEDLAPPLHEPPMFPPTVEPTLPPTMEPTLPPTVEPMLPPTVEPPVQGASTPPAPMDSPKLPKDMVLSLHGDSPPVPPPS